MAVPLSPRIGSRSVTCPYCYERYPVRDIRFRCNTRLSRTGKRCQMRLDEVLLERTGLRRELGPVFAANGSRPAARCTLCDNETRYRVCPICHSQLPTEFGMVDDLLIAMVGARTAGKTVYMTVLVHEMMNRTGAQLDAAIMAADDDTRRRFAGSYESNLYQHRQMPPATQSASVSDNRVAPLVFRLSMARRRLVGSAPLHTLLSFFDAAGEDLVSQDSVDLNGRYLGNADGIIVLLDPLQMAAPRRAAAPGSNLPEATQESPASVLERITDLLRSRPGTAGREQIDTPLAVVFPKIDALAHTLGKGSPLLAEPPGGRGFDDADSRDVHYEVMRLLKEWGSVQIDQIVDKHYRRYRYFGVSALGANPTSDQRAPLTGIAPYRVTDPFLWLLSEFGAITAHKAGRRR